MHKRGRGAFLGGYSLKLDAAIPLFCAILDGDKMNKEDLLKSIPSLKKLYVVVSDYTRMPYLECDAETSDDLGYLFFTEEKAKDKVQELEEIRQKTSLLELNKSSILKNFTIMLLCGFNAVKIHDGTQEYLFQLEEIVKLGSHEGLPPEKRPVENRTLQLTMLYFCQELRKDPEHPNQRLLRELEEEMLVNVTRGRFLMPCREQKEGDQVQMQLITLKVNNDTNMIPIFTDNLEFEKLPKDDSLKLMVVPFESMLHLPFPNDGAGYLINPMGAGIPIREEFLQRIREERQTV